MSPFGVASCTRVSMPSTPAIAKNTNDVIIMRMPMTEWLTAASRCSPGSGGPDRGQFAVQPQALARLRQLFERIVISCQLPCCGACASAAAKSSGRSTMTSNRIPAWPYAAEFVAQRLDASRLIGLDAQAVQVPGHGVDLAGKRGIQNAWMTSGW